MNGLNAGKIIVFMIGFIIGAVRAYYKHVNDESVDRFGLIFGTIIIGFGYGFGALAVSYMYVNGCDGIE